MRVLTYEPTPGIYAEEILEELESMHKLLILTLDFSHLEGIDGVDGLCSVGEIDFTLKTVRKLSLKAVRGVEGLLCIGEQAVNLKEIEMHAIDALDGVVIKCPNIERVKVMSLQQCASFKILPKTGYSLTME